MIGRLKLAWVLIRVMWQYIRITRIIHRAKDRRVMITRARWYGSQIQDEDLQRMFLQYIATIEKIYVTEPEQRSNNDPLIPT